MKRILMVVGILVVCAAVAVGLLFLVRGDDETSSSRPGEQVTEDDWQAIRTLPEPRFSLDPTSSYFGRPVKGELTVSIEPEDVLVPIPETLNVYEILPPVQTEEDLREFAARFGVEGEIVKNSKRLYISEGDEVVDYRSYKEIVSFYNEEFRRGPETEDDLPEVPSDEECKSIAWEITSEKGLLPPGAEIASVGAERVSFGDVDHAVTIRHVGIAGSVDGYWVRGPGMMVHVDIGDKGRLAGFSTNLRELRLYGTYPVKPLEQAIEEAKQGIGTMNLEPDSENPVATSLDIFYYADPSKPENRLLLPVYSFAGGDCCIYVPAVNQN